MDNIEKSENIEEIPKKTRQRKSPESFTITVDGNIIDCNSYNWGEKKLTQKEKLFVFWFTYPESTSYHNATRAARKAGYSPKTAYAKGYYLKTKDYIATLIKQFDNLYIKTTIEDTYNRIMKRKVIRAEFIGNDFYDVKQGVSESGNTFIKASIKLPDELTEEQKLCIDGIDFVGKNFIPNYKLPNRKAEEDKIIELYEKLNGKNNSDDYEVETTAEIIKGNLQVKTKVMRKNDKMIELSDLKNNATGERVEED